MSQTLLRASRRAISYGDHAPYNKRWQWQFRSGWFAEPVNEEPRRVNEPDNQKTDPHFGSIRRDFSKRILPWLKIVDGRLHRLNTPYDKFFLPGLLFAGLALSPLSLGFKFLTVLPAIGIYVRQATKCVDPEIPETFLRSMLEENETVSKYFKVETTQVLDYQVEYTRGFPDAAEFPEFENKLFRFFNADASFTKGHFVFGDLETNATMKVSFETMPVRGISRFQIGEPYFFFDVVADINVDGALHRVVLVDRKETLKDYRPFSLML